MVAGGFTTLNGARSDEVEILTLHSSAWRAGPALPAPVAYAASVPYNGGIVVLGGQASDAVYRLMPDQGRA